MRKYEAFLTNNGNIAVTVREDDPTQEMGRSKVAYNAFITPKGEWLREANGNEIADIAFNYALQLAVCSTNDEFFGEVLPEQAPIWEFMGSIRIEEDYSNYKPETCNNGGDYAFYTSLDVYHTMINGKSIIRGVTRYGTSAEFSYDVLNGGFQTNLIICEVLNAVDEAYTTDPTVEGTIKVPIWYDTQGYDTCFLEQISSLYKLEDIYNMKSHVIEKDEVDDIIEGEYDSPDKDDIIAKLIIAGASFAPIKQKTSRNQRRG